MINVVITKKDLEGILPIHYAVLFGNIKIIEFLLSSSVPVDVNLEGIPLIHLSLSFGGKIFLI
jgi:ankyrin repeat protein